MTTDGGQGMDETTGGFERVMMDATATASPTSDDEVMAFGQKCE